MANSAKASNRNPVISFTSRHSGAISLTLSRYQRQWFLTYPRAYGMVAPMRIHTVLNDPKDSESESAEHAKTHFWLNSTASSSPYDANDTNPSTNTYIGSIIHELLDAEPAVVKLTGRKRKEVSKYHGDEGKEIECVELEVIIPEAGFLKQCYYCLAWEHEKQEENRFKNCGDDVFWCRSCEARGPFTSSVSGTLEKLKRDTIFPMIDKDTHPRDSLYSYSY